ncbi:MAG: HigA family addiction module antitoxin [Chloroflexota bacterium]|nr:HigA family addiction module antitoxin [Chloroflexota bacterium]
MANNTQNQYMPDYVSPPGETLFETLEVIGMTQADLAERTGRPRKTINKIVRGKTSITPETALQLERVLGVPASFWNNRERHYQESLARAQERQELQHQADWLDIIPVKEMIALGWVQAFEDKVDQLVEVIEFFGVTSPTQWESLWLGDAVAFRQSPAFESDPGAVSAWLRKGELDALEIDCQPYNEEGFREALWAIREFTTESPEVFVPQMQTLCAQSGVAAVFVPELPKTHTSGATRWLSPRKALIQLSLRYKADDRLWFTFFHEAGHILLHGKRDVFLEDGDEKNEKEHQADRFAADFLIPPQEFVRFEPAARHYSKTDVTRFAKRIGIAPGIVVGRLQREKRIPFSHMNGLKQRLIWVDKGREL